MLTFAVLSVRYTVEPGSRTLLKPSSETANSAATPGAKAFVNKTSLVPARVQMSCWRVELDVTLELVNDRVDSRSCPTQTAVSARKRAFRSVLKNGKLKL